MEFVVKLLQNLSGSEASVSVFLGLDFPSALVELGALKWIESWEIELRRDWGRESILLQGAKNALWLAWDSLRHQAQDPAKQQARAFLVRCLQELQRAEDEHLEHLELEEKFQEAVARLHLIVDPAERARRQKLCSECYFSKQPPPSEHSCPALHECRICFEEVLPGKLAALPCGHEYHLSCISSWAASTLGVRCPVCRKGPLRKAPPMGSAGEEDED